LLFAGSALFDSSDAAAQLRCGDDIVSPSDSRERVGTVCGEPDESSERWVFRRLPTGDWYDSRLAGRVVHIETWRFAFGPERLVQQLTFEDGVLVRLESRGFGTGRQHDVRTARRSDREWVLLPRAASRLRHRSN